MLRVPSTGALIALALMSSLVGSARTLGSRGKVVFASAKRAYLDVGEADGITLELTLTLKRGNRNLGACKVDLLAQHSSACAMAGARIGDTFALPATPPRSPGPVAHAVPAPAPIAEIEREHERIVDAPYALVDAGRELATGYGGGMASVRAGHEAWATLFGSGSTFQDERVHVSVDGVPLGLAGFRAYAELEALVYTERPANARFRPGTDAQFYAWEAEVASRDPGRPFALALGRMWPWHLPGLATLDGGQAGWKSRDGEREAGVYGGGLPDPVTLEPAFDRWTAGAYGAYTSVGARDSTLRLVRAEGRVGMSNLPDAGKALDAEVLLAGFVAGWLDVGAEARALLATSWNPGVMLSDGPGLEALRAHVGVHLPRLNFLASVRYLDATSGLDQSGLGPAPYGLDGYTTAEADVSWDVGPGLVLGASGGVDEESTGLERDRAWVGPELALPVVFGRLGGLSLAYREERGWLPGRSGSLQVALHPGDSVNLLVRTSYFEDRGGNAGNALTFRELGLYASAQFRLVRWLALRASLLARVGVDGVESGVGAATPSGLIGTIDLTATP
jgi:hypothetical protein